MSNETKPCVVAKNPETGRYFNGRAFESLDKSDAVFLDGNTKAEDFRVSWICPVVLEAAH